MTFFGFLILLSIKFHKRPKQGQKMKKFRFGNLKIKSSYKKSFYLDLSIFPALRDLSEAYQTSFFSFLAALPKVIILCVV